MADIQLIAIASIRDNVGLNFTVTDQIDPETANFKVRAVPRITAPGSWVALPEHIARGLIASGAAREPDARELQLKALAGGNHVA